MNGLSLGSTIHFCAGVLDPVDLVPILCTLIDLIPARLLNRRNLGVRGYVEYEVETTNREALVAPRHLLACNETLYVSTYILS